MGKNIVDNLFLPASAKEFIGSIRVGDKKRSNENPLLQINPYLSQNRFCYRKEEEENKGRKERKGNKGKTGKQLVKYDPILLPLVKKKVISDEEFCGGELLTIMKSLNSRNKMLAESHACCAKYPFAPQDKLIIGEGGSAYLEVQPLRLHQLFGIPYIPASAIKGALRGTWISEGFEGDPEKAEADESFTALFGGGAKKGQATEGSLMFFDTFPEKFTLGLDVQTNHYKDYYQNKKNPTDDQYPLPIFFMCLRDSAFTILIACMRNELWQIGKEEVDHMVELMTTQYGIGAKTALGYGVQEPAK